MSPSMLAIETSRPMPSIIITNKKGDIGSPCQIPLDGKKGFNRSTFNIIEKPGDEKGP